MAGVAPLGGSATNFRMEAEQTPPILAGHRSSATCIAVLAYLKP
jgi:hypothetical protein